MLFIGCSSDDNGITTPLQVIDGSGAITVVNRPLADFSSIEMNVVGDIKLISGAAVACSISVDDNIHQYIQTEVSGNRLVISKPNTISLQNYDLTITLVMTDLETIELNGVGTVASMNQFVADEVSVTATGVASLNLSLNVDRLTTMGSGVTAWNLIGAAGKHTCSMESNALISAFDFLTDTTVIVLEGIGNAEVTAFDHLNATIAGSGSVYYKGNPSISTTITGTGQVIDAN
jgi:hypothetical protein